MADSRVGPNEQNNIDLPSEQNNYIGKNLKSDTKV